MPSGKAGKSPVGNNFAAVLPRCFTSGSIGIVGSGAARNKTSMRRDIEAGRPSEVEAIYGSVIERGRSKSVPTPTLEALAALMLGLERARDEA